MNKYFEQLYKESFNDFCELLKSKINNEEKTFIVTANPETFMTGEKDEEINKMLLDKKVYKVPDGIGIVKAANMVKMPVKERITGVDIAVELLNILNDTKKNLYLFGASEEVINLMKKKLSTDYPNIRLIGSTNGYVKDKDKIMKEIIKLKPDVLLVALGIPAQEKLIYKYFDKFKKGIFVGVGGSFDVISGFKKRAPKLFIKTNTEWLYRIVSEPKRIKRFWNSNVKFLFRIKKKNNA